MMYKINTKSVATIIFLRNISAQGWVGNTISGRSLLFPTNNSLGLSPLNVGTGTNNPTDQFHTNGSVRFQGLTKHDTLSRVLVQNDTGRLFWPDARSLGDMDWLSIPTNLPPQNIQDNKYTLGTCAIGSRTNPANWKLFVDSGVIFVNGAIDSNRTATNTINNTSFF